MKVDAWEFIPSNKISKCYSVASQLVCSLSSMTCKIWLEWFNRPVIYNRNRFHQLLNQVGTNNGRGLVTVSNHYSCMDDPILWGMRSWKQIFSISRWTLTAEEICFKSRFTCWFFAMGRCVPIVRGDGVYQKGMNYCLNKLNEGNWIHIFPEGGVNKTKEKKRFKWGVGRLIADSVATPIVLPFYHVGMDGILPNKRPYILQVRKDVTVVFGEPIDFTDDLTRLRKQNKSQTEIRKYLTDRLQEEIWRLKDQTDELHRVRTRS